MKTKKIIFMAAFVALTGSVFAQFGVHAGVGFSSTKFEEIDGGSDAESEKFGTAISPNFGVFYRMALGSDGKFAIQPELNYLVKGGREKIDFLGESLTTTLKLNYLELPVYFMYNGAQPSGFYGGIGPAFNFGLSGKIKLEFDGESESEDIKFGSNYDEDDLKGFHMAINGLAGYQLENGINVNIFVSQSITNSAIKDEGEVDGRVKFFNFGLRVGYLIGGGTDRSNKVKLKQVF